MDNAQAEAQLRAVADYLAGKPIATVVTAATPEGFVRVTPTGPNAIAHGVSRLYPTMGALGIPNDRNAWAYAVHLAFNNMRRPDGTLYCSQGAANAIGGPNADAALQPYLKNGYSVAAAGGDPTPFFAEAIDRVEHGDDWATQAELDKARADAQAHAGAAWISQPGGQTVPGGDGFEPVPES